MKNTHNPFSLGELSSAVSTTKAQQEIWASLEMDDNSTLCYNESIRIELKGELDSVLLDRAVSVLVKRHDSLRAVFSQDGLSFCVTKMDAPGCEYRDISNESSKEEILSKIISDETSRKFDLVNKLPIVFTLVKIQKNTHFLFISAHHIVCDGWSMGVITNELGQIYTSLNNGVAWEKKEAFQFNQYCQDQLQSVAPKNDLKYWLDLFQHNPIPNMDLPLDYARPDFRSFESARIDKVVPVNLVKKLKKLGASEGSSFYISLMNIFQVLVAKIKNQEKTVIGISAAGQALIDEENLVGHLVSLLPVKGELSFDESFLENLKSTRTAVLDGLDHQHVGYGEILQALKINRENGKIPLINIIFNVDQQYPGQGLEFDGFEASYETNPRHFENFEIFINATSCGDKVVLECQYNTNLFKKSTIDNWLGQYIEIIDQVCSNPNILLSDLNLDITRPSIVSKAVSPALPSIKVSNSKTELAVKAIWIDVLGLTGDIKHNEGFFELGGHSLLATEVLKRVNELFDISLKIKNIFQAPTIAELSEVIDKSNQTAEEVVTFSNTEVEFHKLNQNQVRSWYLEQLDPATTMHNLPSCIKFKSKVSYKILQKSMNVIVKRHTLLRSVIELKDSKPVFRVIPENEVNVDLVSKKIKDSDLDTFIAEFRKEKINLDNGSPLFITQLVETDKGEWFFFFMPHHIAFDGWSFDIFFEELNLLYTAFENKETPLLSEQKANYNDFVNYMSADTAVFTEQAKFWKEKLSGELPILDLPTDYRRLKETSHSGGTVSFHIDEELASSLKSIAKTYNSSLYNIFLACFNMTLSHFSGQDDLIVGTPVRRREYREFENIIGNFVNTIAVRSEINWDESFKSNLDMINKASIEAISHSDISFEEVLKGISWERDIGFTPIYQSLFSYQDVTKRGTHLGSKKYEQINSKKASTHTDIDMWIKKSDDKIVGAFGYRVELFKETSVARMKDTFINLLRTACKNESKSLNEGSIMPEDLEVEILKGFNPENTPLDSNVGIISKFTEQVIKSPNSVACSFEDTKLTYSELDKKSDQVCQALINKGLSQGEVVGLSVERDENLLVSLIAILKAGAGYIPLDPSFPADRLEYMMESSQMKRIILNKKSRLNINSNIDSIFLEDLIDTAQEINSPKLPSLNTDLGRTAYIIYTSGSTGNPKGVEISEKAMVNFLNSMSKTPGIKAGDKLLAVTTLSFDISVLELFLPVLNGAEVIITSKYDAMDGEALKELIEKHNVNIMQATPSTWRLLLANGWKQSPQFKALCGGEALPLDLANILAGHIGELWNMYGPTETTVWSSCYQVEKNCKKVLIGKPIDNTQLYILDDHLNPVPIGRSGNLYISGEGLAKGYYKRSDLTAERFITKKSVSNTLIYDTGDIARFNDEGVVECLGRNDGQVKVRGYRIELSEIESVISKVSGVKECVVITREDKAADVRIVAYFIANNKIEEASLRKFCSTKLPFYMVPSHFIQMSEFPKTLNEKIDKKNLPAPLEGAQSTPQKTMVEAAETSEKSDLYKKVENIWQDVLGIEQIGPTDNFFEIGGHSMNSIEIFSRINSDFGVSFQLAALLESPSLEEQVQKIEKSLNSNTPKVNSNGIPDIAKSLVSIKPSGNLNPLYCFHGVGGNVLNYVPLISMVKSERPIIGVQCAGVDGKSELPKSILQMAHSYANEIRMIQPEGPYLLCGGSMGGLVALEVGRVLKEDGAEVEDIIMFDTIGPDRTKGSYQSGIKRSFSEKVFSSIKYRFKSLEHRVILNLCGLSGREIPYNTRFYYIEKNNYQLMKGHFVNTFNGSVSLIRSLQSPNGIYKDPKLGWGSTIKGEVNTIEIEGSHEDFLESPSFKAACISLLK